MKFLIAAFLISISFTGSSMIDASASTNSFVKSEISVGRKDRKKSRRHRKINNKRKRHCAKAARRNFAG